MFASRFVARPLVRRGASKVATSASTAARVAPRAISRFAAKQARGKSLFGISPAVSTSIGAALGAATAIGSVVYLTKDVWVQAYTTYADGKPTVVFVLGGPGAGKGTQCTNIVDTYGFVHLSAGELLREEMATPGSPYGKMIDEIIKQGQIVPSHVTVGLLRNAMDKSSVKRFLIDGFPRNFENNAAFERELGDKVNIPFILFFDVPEEVMEKRLLIRGETSGRTDDNIASIKKRFKTFQEQTMPVIDYYGKQNKVVHVNGDRDPKLVFEDLKKVFDKLYSSKK